MICRGPHAEAAPDHTCAASMEQGSEAGHSGLRPPGKVIDPMQHKPEPNINALFRQANKVDEFLKWLREEGDALISAADLLGGQTWAAKATDIVTTAKKGGNVAARRKTLIAIRGLLEGDLAGFHDRDEAWRFAALHPDDPEATRAMLCADALGRGIRALEALHLAGVTSISGGAR